MSKKKKNLHSSAIKKLNSLPKKEIKIFIYYHIRKWIADFLNKIKMYSIFSLHSTPPAHPFQKILLTCLSSVQNHPFLHSWCLLPPEEGYVECFFALYVPFDILISPSRTGSRVLTWDAASEMSRRIWPASIHPWGRRVFWWQTTKTFPLPDVLIASFAYSQRPPLDTIYFL